MGEFRFRDAPFYLGGKHIGNLSGAVESEGSITAVGALPRNFGFTFYSKITNPEVLAQLEEITRRAKRRPVSIVCKRCGAGRLYASGDRALRAARRWARHVCRRGAKPA